MLINRAALAVVGLSLAALVGCGGGEPAAGPSSAPSLSRPAPLPTQDWYRQACHLLPSGMLEVLEELGATRLAGEAAEKSGEREMQELGRRLLAAVTAREAADLYGTQDQAVDANLDISRVALEISAACGARYGDGPW
ncbi:hypothetical protein [Micromonospora sp. WMMC273]|uniref:hypothetical protein n=1 Tax=Micromonospora sp. WMMC273 TaxID=3015157 RepID=UPI0022B61DC2|nr:hypothetical protein [Micromonospora sp. WMMC273]MCZ7478843.1 hypothetical protein [Micromonospora sp. WMMC273]